MYIQEPSIMNLIFNPEVLKTVFTICTSVNRAFIGVKFKFCCCSCQILTSIFISLCSERDVVYSCAKIIEVTIKNSFKRKKLPFIIIIMLMISIHLLN